MAGPLTGESTDPAVGLWSELVEVRQERDDATALLALQNSLLDNALDETARLTDENAALWLNQRRLERWVEEHAGVCPAVSDPNPTAAGKQSGAV